MRVAVVYVSNEPVFGSERTVPGWPSTENRIQHPGFGVATRAATA